MPGLVGASLTSFVAELHNCSARLHASYPTAQLVYRLSNWVCSRAFTGTWRANLHSYLRHPDSSRFTLACNEFGAIALNAAEREIELVHEAARPRTTAAVEDDPVASPAAALLLDSLTGGMCECSCDGLHYPPLMPALAVALARKLEFGGTHHQLAANASAPTERRQLAGVVQWAPQAYAQAAGTAGDPRGGGAEWKCE